MFGNLPLSVCAMVAALALGAGAAGAQTSPPATRTPWDSVYTVEQAARGDTTFHASCAACHATGQFTGPTFLSAWEGGTVYQLFKSISTQMPQDHPGSLSSEQYASVVAYLFQLNGFPAGVQAFPSDAAELKQIIIQSKPERP